ncbi:hypothetical protein CANARDRAFT_22230 [[Candida] arabinofermentans NRRL YB-2248]|uniref:Uncharacterized protein n=1 Tax=[Candida] arabinofermentans NRRL YB-2248 TaxID=983967 RepID=A0A1E4T3J5_9ASCO|nr:hypothetical protein CANARDRAFT_22230 [[Candida] arabinofermentans NRRL YB-2248]
MVKDVKRAELVKPYVHIPPPAKTVASNFVGQNLPMVAMFLRNKPMAWACAFLAIQGYLNAPLIAAPNDDSTPAYFKIIFAVIALGASYVDLFFPSVSPVARKAAEEAAAAAAAATNTAA